MAVSYWLLQKVNFISRIRERERAGSGCTMIGMEDLESAMAIAEPLFERLQHLYALLPDTRCECDRPGVCCAFLPEMTIVEAMQWIGLMRAMPDPALVEALRDFVAFYLTSPARRSNCPFLKEGACGVYEHRPFACRAYGMWSREMGEARTRESREERKALLLMWKRYDLALPPEKAALEMDYCPRVHVLSKKPMKDHGLMKLLERVYHLGDPLSDVRSRFENEFHSDVSFLIASLALGHKKAVLGKFAVVKEIVKLGSDARLGKMVAKVAPEVLRGH